MDGWERFDRMLHSTLEMGDTSSDSTRIRGLYTFCFAKPGSITYTMPSIVSDVSAMFVETCTDHTCTISYCSRSPQQSSQQVTRLR